MTYFVFLLHFPHPFDLVLSMPSFQNAVRADILPIIHAVIPEYLLMGRAPAAGYVHQWLHQQVSAVSRTLQMWLQMLLTQRDLTSQAGLHCSLGLITLVLRTAVTYHHPLLLQALWAYKSLLATAGTLAPGLLRTGQAKAVATGKGLRSTKEVTTHGTCVLFLHGAHSSCKFILKM